MSVVPSESKLPRCYCLSCSQIPWRNEAVEQRFRDAGLDVEMFFGVHGATAGIVPTLSHFDSPGHYHTPGKLSITISKLLIWQHLLAGTDDHALIFENDVVFCPDFKSELLRSMESLPADWDVVHVGHCCAEDKPTTRINDRVSEVKHPMCCHAILWTKRAMLLAMEEFRRASWGTTSDIILARKVYPRLRHYSFTPPLAFQDQTLSEAAATGRWDSIHGWFDYERLYAEALDRVRGPAVFVEVGCWLGRSTAYMAEEIKRRLLPVDFYAVDTWKGKLTQDGGTILQDGDDMLPAFLRNMSRAGVIDYVRPLQMSSLEAAGRFSDHSIDFVFIDGDHEYASVVADIRAWLPKVKPGGTIAGHDIDRESVCRAVSDTLRGRARKWEQCWIKR